MGIFGEVYNPEFRIRIRMFLALPDPHLEPLVTSRVWIRIRFRLRILPFSQKMLSKVTEDIGTDPHPDPYQYVTDPEHCLTIGLYDLGICRYCELTVCLFGLLSEASSEFTNLFTENQILKSSLDQLASEKSGLVHQLKVAQDQLAIRAQEESQAAASFQVEVAVHLSTRESGSY